MIEKGILWLLVVVFATIFGAQVITRVRLIRRAKNNLRLDHLGARVRTFLLDVVCQRQVIRERPVAGLAHALVFWGFVAFAGYSTGQFLKGLGLVDVTDTRVFQLYARALIPFATAVIVGITYLGIRRAVLRPEALGPHVSAESILIAGLILALMVTFLLEFRLSEGPLARVNWWAHALMILVFLALIPNSKHFHLMLSPVTVFLRAPVLGLVPNLDFEREEVGLETVQDLEAKQVLDAFTCVECGRCQDNCPAYGTDKRLNPKNLILQNEDALLTGPLDRQLVDVFDPGVLWQCTTCGACERQCPVGIEHLPLIIGARRGLVSNGEAPESLGAVYNHLERRGNIWGMTYDQRQKFVASAGLEIFDPVKHDYLVWLGCAGAFEADYQRALRALFNVLGSLGVRFGVLSKERCTGDLAKRTGNEYLFQELAQQNVAELQAAGVKRIVSSCPHCVRTLGVDYRAFGFEAEVVHSAVLVAALATWSGQTTGEAVAFHDPCYLGRYGGHVDEPRTLLTRVGATLREHDRSGSNPFCCGAGGGLLFEEHEEGARISQRRLEQLQATGAQTLVTACPFCSIMLKGAQASSNASTELVDLMSFLDGKLQGTPRAGRAD